MIGRLAERRKTLPQVRDNYATESEYSSECHTDGSFSSDRMCLLLYFTGGRGGVREERKGGGAVEVFSPWREAPQHFSLNLSILCRLGTRAEDSSPRAPSSPLGSFIPSGDSALISLSFFSPSSFFLSRGCLSLEAAASFPPAALTRQSAVES